MAWIDPSDKQAMESSQHTGKDEHTYSHHEDGIKEIEKRQSTKFPVRHMPIDDLRNTAHNYNPDKKEIQAAMEKYHNGDKLPPVKVSPTGEILDHPELVDMAKKLGLNHIPVIIMGNPKLKKDLEDKLKDQVLVEEEEEDSASSGNKNLVPVQDAGSTAKAKPEHKIEGLEIGADAYLTKPFNTDILRQTITNLIENRELLRNVFGGNQHQDDKIEKIAIKSSDEVLIERIMKVINDNLSNPELNVEMLAQNVGMSRVHMHRKLKELTNQSARDFIRNIRLKQAGALLASKKSSVSEVAYSVGFVNLSHFSNSFKEFYGMSPSDYASKNMDEGKN